MFRSSGPAGWSGLLFSSAEAMPVPSISKPPVTSAVCRPRFAQVCIVMVLLYLGSLAGFEVGAHAPGIARAGKRGAARRNCGEGERAACHEKEHGGRRRGARSALPRGEISQA